MRTLDYERLCKQRNYYERFYVMSELETASIDYAIKRAYERLEQRSTYLSEVIGWAVIDELLDARIALMSLDEHDDN